MRGVHQQAGKAFKGWSALSFLLIIGVAFPGSGDSESQLWGNDWGVNGIAWVGYADFKEFVREAYGIDPMPKRGAAN